LLNIALRDEMYSIRIIHSKWPRVTSRMFFPLNVAIAVVKISHGLENSHISVECHPMNLTGCLVQVLRPESLHKSTLDEIITVAAKREFLGYFGSL
jgi:hypothetical protein